MTFHPYLSVYIVTTRNFQAMMKREYNQNWEGSLNFEKVVRYLPHFKSVVQLPIYVLGIDLQRVPRFSVHFHEMTLEMISFKCLSICSEEIFSSVLKTARGLPNFSL